MNRALVRARVLQCTDCSLHQSCKSPVPFRGPNPAKIAIVGEAPGRVEDEQTKPFVGPSGQLVSEWLARVGLNEEEIAFTNAVHCYPNRTPTEKEVEICRTNLNLELTLVEPSFVFLFGGVAVSSWWSKMRMGDVRGLWWKGAVSGLPWRPWMMATWHPAAVLRNRTLETEVIADLLRFRIRTTTPLLGVDDEIVPPSVTCLMCGDWATVWRDHNNRDVTNLSGEPSHGALAWCDKHDGLRMGTAGKGRTKTDPPAKKAKGSRKKAAAKKSAQAAFDIEKYRVK